ncbi:lipase [Amycolatopsis endophytica]|uniref:Dienelactone hydrolase n=1 Tax=Amycolatopsis endophytica TaxID=860233 RepID=A0A853B697_9PSEU|nr:lipase [Amycolatopsis endophytica]NYI90066.1 dienelactone hydrolase [Amycolatopsis endophytica]
MTNLKRRTALALCAGLLAVAAPASAAEPIRLSLPPPAGPYPVGTTELHLVDRSRIDPWGPGGPRELMISVWYPARAAHGPATRHLAPEVAADYERTAAVVGVRPGVADFAGTRTHARDGASVLPGSRPVVLYSPGGGESRALGTTLAEDLVSHGFVVVTVDHTYASPVRFPDRMEYPAHGVDMARMMRERALDTGFVLDQLEVLHSGGNPDAAHRALPAGLGRTLDLSRVGMFGHSMGGFTAAEAMLGDRRIDAGANLDGSMDPASGQASARGADRPFLLMGGGTSAGAPHTHRHAADWAAFWANSTGWKRDVHLPTAEHGSFTDAQVLVPQIGRRITLPSEEVAAAIGTIDPRRSVAAQRDYLAAFFALHLRGWPTDLFDRPSHPDVRLVP